MDITVTVKAVAHGTTPITMASTAPVQDLRAAAAQSFGAPPSALRLVLSGRFISDDTTLAEAGVVDGSVIHALVKQDPETPGASSHGATQARPQGPQPDDDEEEWRPRPQRLVDPPPPAASPSIDLSGLFGSQAGGFFGAIADSLAAASAQGQPAAPAAPTTAPSGSGTAAGATDPLDELLSGFFAGPTATADPSSAPAQRGGAGSAPTQAPGPGLEGFDFGAVAGSVSDFMQAAAPVIQGAFAEAAREMTEERTTEQNRVRVEEVESSSSSASGDVSYLSEVVSEDEAAPITEPIPAPNAHGTNSMGAAPAPARVQEAPTPPVAQAQPPAQVQAQPQAPPQAHAQAQVPPFFFAAPLPPLTFAVNVHVNPADLATLHTKVCSFYTRMGAAQFPAHPHHDHAHDAAHHAAQQQVAEAHQQLHQQMLQQVQQQQRAQQQAPPPAAVEAPNRGTAARLAHDVQHEVRLENAGQAHGYPRPSLAQVAVSSGVVPPQTPSTTTVGGSEGQVGEAAPPTLLSRVSRVMLDGGDVPGLLRVVRGDWSAFDPLRPALAAALRASAERSSECETAGAAAAAAEDTLVTAPMRRVMADDLTAGVLGLFEFPALGVALRQHAQPGVEVPAVVHVAARELAADVVDLILDGAPQSERGLFSSHLRSRVVRRVGHLSSYLRRHGVRGDSESDRDSASSSLMAALVEAVLDAATAPLPELRASLRPSVSVAATAIVAWRAEYEAALRLPADDDLFAVAAACGGLSDETLSRAVSSLGPEGLGAEAGASPGADSGLEALLGAALMRAAGSADSDTMRAPSPNAAADLDAALGGLRGQLRQL